MGHALNTLPLAVRQYVERTRMPAAPLPIPAVKIIAPPPGTVILDLFVSGEPKPQPRPRGQVMRLRNGKMTVHIYDKLEAYEPKEPGKRRVRKAWDAAYWRDRIIAAIRANKPAAPAAGPLRCDVTFLFPRPEYMLAKKYSRGRILHYVRPDRDNLDKLILDAITQAGWYEVRGETIKTPLVWHDDGQVCQGEIQKYYVAIGEEPGARIVVKSLEEQQGGLF
jgi:Holliday junction resolvase RusA-like endonuclease